MSLKGLPQLLFFNDGAYSGKLVGELSEEEIEANLKDLFS
ncbi:MAG: thioredoxin [Gracilibacteraceae bacterium]|nr:thioredoxin [Gracilibacteraceae bacterium]